MKIRKPDLDRVLGLVAVLMRPALNEVYLIAVSYVVLATFLALEIALSATVLPLNENDEIQGLWAVIFFTYITYALLPIRLQKAIFAGCVLTVVHFLCIVSFGNVHQLKHVSCVDFFFLISKSRDVFYLFVFIILALSIFFL